MPEPKEPPSSEAQAGGRPSGRADDAGAPATEDASDPAEADNE